MCVREALVLTYPVNSQDCTCLAGCKYCAIELRLDVVCNDNRTMEVTSNHLEVVEFTSNTGTADIIQEGEELTKRAEGFGYPVGKSRSLSCRSKISIAKRFLGRRPVSATGPHL
jgi:hypothetical protein